MPKMAQIFLKNYAYQIEENHIVFNFWAILVPCLGHIRAIFKLFLPYLCFANETFMTESNKAMRHVNVVTNSKDNVRAMFELFLQYLCFWMTEMAQIFTVESCNPNRRIPINVKLLRPYNSLVWAMFGPY